MVWNGTIMATFVNYLSIVGKSKSFLESNDDQPPNTWLGIILCGFALVYPFLAARFLIKNHNDLLIDESFIKKFSNWWIDIETSKRGRRVVLYYPSFLIKRWFIVLITVLAGQISGIEFVALLNLNVASVVVYGWIKPHAIQKRRILEYFNDVMIMKLSYSMICMTAFNLDLEV